MANWIAVGALWMAVAAGAREIANVSITLVLARRLGPDAYGLVGMAAAVAGLGQVLLSRGIRETLVQRQELTKRQLDSAFWLLCALGLAAAGASFLLAGPLAAFFREPQVAELARWLSPLPILAALSNFHTALLLRQLRFRAAALRALYGIGAGGAAGIGMAYSGCGASSLVGLLLGQAVAETIFVWSASRWRPGFQLSAGALGDIGGSSLWLFGNSALGFADQQIMRVFVGYAYGAAVLGFYVISWRLIEIVLSIVVTPLSNTALIAFARSQAQPQQLRHLFLAAATIVAFFAFPAFSGGAIIAPDLLPLALGPQWVRGIPVLQILCLFAVTDALLHVYDALLIGSGRGRWMFAISAACVALLLVMVAVFGRLGVLAAALIFLARNLAIVPLYVAATKSVLGAVRRREFEGYASVATATAAMVFLLACWRLGAPHLPMAVTVASSIAIGAVCYLGAAFFCARPILIEAYLWLRGASGAVAVTEHSPQSGHPVPNRREIVR